ncbi:MAG: DUF3500 domain-containing protein [Planctomycetaceae bacterium]|nr:DUF3500 domain-containing protein [Planctomycetaceae bacterium]
MHRRVRWLLLFVVIGLTPVVGMTFYREAAPGVEMSEAAAEFVDLLDAEQRKTALLSYEDDTDQRVNWHFIPKDHRKGLQIKHMTKEQRAAAHALLKSALSQVGYSKAEQIMEIEALLAEFEGKGRFIRDPERYYFTIFGANFGGRWGLSVEGHHLSLNFVVEDNKVISVTPQFFGANPALVKNENKSGFEVGTRILAKEEQLGFDLVNSLDDAQQKQAVIAEKAPEEIRAAGETQPPKDAPVGIPAGKLTSEQQKVLRELIDEYATAVPAKISAQRLAAMEEAGFDGVHFAWAGATEPGIGHYYRIQGETFLIEFVNTQPDVAGNPANHIHCVWRDMHGDFAIPIE